MSSRISSCIPACGALALGLAFSLPDAAAQSAGAGFNPRISLVLQGSYAERESDAPPEVPGILLGPETELRPEGFSLGETELVLEANIDDAWHGWAAVALENEDGDTVVALEEAYVNSLALPAGLALKAGRFFSDIGYHNRQHSHGWDFADAPLVYRALLANQYGDDGLQLRWIAPAALLVEIGGEALRGAGYPGGGDNRSGIGAWTAFARVGGDWGASLAWRIGGSYLAADADGRVTAEEDAPESFTFTGDARLAGLDAVLKWAPQGNPRLTHAVLQAEVWTRDEDGTLVAANGVDPEVASPYRGEAVGAYLQGVWQFKPRWRVGLRYDWLSTDNDLPANGSGAFDPLLATGDDPERWTAMVDFSRTEFSRLRLQLADDRTRPGGESDPQLVLQYVFSLGAHPAHAF